MSAGGTREPTPVRYIGNRSTGKMGVAVAEAALRGARVTLVAANLDVSAPAEATTIAVESAAELRTALHRLTHAEDGRAGFDALVMAAAVERLPAGHRGRHEAGTRRLADSRTGGDPRHPRPDRADRAGHGPGGRDELRAAEPASVPRRLRRRDGLLDRSADKLRRKGVDLLVATWRSPGRASAPTPTGSILDADGGRTELPLMPKRAVADEILDRVARALDDRDGAARTG